MDPTALALYIPVLLFSVIAHEYAHGYAAFKQGDPTAYQLGRLTWNPIKHIDPFMTIVMPAFLFYLSGGRFMLGGAKPVPVNPRNYRNFKRGDIIVSLAGVATNFVIALIATALIAVTGLIGQRVAAAAPMASVVQYMMYLAVQLNLFLIIFNLIPIPPLDGSHVMKYLLPPEWSLRYQQIGSYGLLILVFLLWSGVLNVVMAPAWVMINLLLGLVQPFFLPSEFLR